MTAAQSPLLGSQMESWKRRATWFLDKQENALESERALARDLQSSILLIENMTKSHDAMREALEKAQEYLWENTHGCTCQASIQQCKCCHTLSEIKAALALASGTTEEKI